MTERDTGRDALMQGIGRLEGTMSGIAKEVSELRQNVVTKEVLEARIAPTQRFVYGLIALVLLAVGAAVIGGVVNREPPALPKIEIIIPTATPVAR
jgi:hypothetical protein